MVRIRIVAALGLALALSLSQAAAAAPEKQCDFQPDIVKLADFVLANRAGLARFKNLRYGAISAYLKLRYQKLSDKDAEALLMPLAKARVARADELLLTWAINTYGVDAALVVSGPKAGNLLLTQGYSASVVRAAIVKEGISALADEWRAMTPEDRFRVEIRVPTALLDKFDTYKNEIGRQALAAGMLQVAAGLAATQGDSGAWDDYAGHVTDKAVLQRALSLWYWTPALVGKPALKRPPAEAQFQKNRERLHQVLIAAAMMPERDFLATYVNQSGKFEEAAKVAETIVTLAADKTAAPWTMDRAWISTYLELLSVADNPADVDAQLKSIPFGGLRHYDGSVRDVLDWMIAADALTPYMLKLSTDNARPGLISVGFSGDWKTWQSAAAAIRDGSDLSALRTTPEMQAITTELLFAAGRQHQLAAFIAAAKPDDMSVNLAEDFANRMDRICYGYLNFPAEAVTFPDTPMFRFD